MEKETIKALESDNLIDITTIGRKSGKPHRIEIRFYNIDGVVYISGMPGTRDWYANILANPEFTFHFKETVNRDLPAKASPITDQAAKREILKVILGKRGFEKQLKKWIKQSPLVSVEFL